MPLIKTITLTLYEYEELSEEAKEKALENVREMFTGGDWWDPIDEQAKECGIEMDSWDLDTRVFKGQTKLPLLGCLAEIPKFWPEDSEMADIGANYQKKFDEAFTAWRATQQDDGCGHWTPEAWRIEFQYEDEGQELTEQFSEEALEALLRVLKLEWNTLNSEEFLLSQIGECGFVFDPTGSVHSRK